MHIVMDLEANGFLDTVTEIHCICTDAYPYQMNFYQGSLYEYHSIFTPDVTLIMHNGIDYDLPALKKVHNFDFKGKVIDTMLLSQILWQERPGGHSLEAWGERLGYPKVQHEDWETFSDEMLHRCKVDVQITKQVLAALEEEAGECITGSWYEYNIEDIKRNL